MKVVNTLQKSILPSPNLSMRALRIALLLVSFTTLYAQQQDSLELLLPSTMGIDRAKLLYELTVYYQRSDQEKLAYYAEESDKFAKENPETAIKAYAALSMGTYYGLTGQLDSAILTLKESYALAGGIRDTTILIKTASTLGRLLISAGKAKDALEYLYSSLRWLERYPDEFTNLKVRTNITWANLELKRYRDAIAFGRKSLPLMENNTWEWVATLTYNNLAVCYGALGNLDSARFYIDKSLNVTERSGDLVTRANAYFILGKIYAESGKPELALQQYKEARTLREKIGNPFFIVSDLFAIADLYHQLGDYKNGVQAAQEALALAEKHNLLLKFDGTYLALAKNLEGLQNYKEAAKYYYLWALTKDSLYQQSQTEAIAEISAKYETEKKEQQLTLQQSQLTQQQIQLSRTYVLVVALFIIIGLIVVILMMVNNKHKRQQQLADKKREVEVKEAYINATIQSQESERKRVAQDLHDGMGQLISALRMTVGQLSPTSVPEERIMIVEKSEKILNDMHREVRGVAFNLMPQTLIQHGLVPALQEMALRINEHGALRIEVTSFGMDARLQEVQEISVYRIVQEWITNVMKYANATRIVIDLVADEGEIRISLEDDGDGFDPSTLEHGAGNGWKNIQSRLGLLKGTINLDSSPGRQGTSMFFQFPLATVRNEKEVA